MSDDCQTIRLGDPLALTLPSIGCGVWLNRLLDLEPDLARLAWQLDSVAPRHLDVLLDLRDSQALERLPGVMALAAERGVAVWLYVVCEDRDPARSLSSLARRLESVPGVPAGMLVTPAAYLKSYQPDGVWPSGASPREALAAARTLWPGLALGGGVPTYFTELNRCRPDPAAIDFITHAVSPIVHAADDRSVMETLESVPDIVASCRALAPAATYRITTTAIGAWTNPYGERLTPNDGTQRVTLSDNDPRQRGQFAAAWSLGFLARAALAGVDSLTLSSLGPPFDIGDSPLHPVGHVITGLARMSGQTLCESPFEIGPLEIDPVEISKVRKRSEISALATLAWQTALPAINEAWITNLTAEPLALGLKRIEIVDVTLLESERDGFQPTPELRRRLEEGCRIALPPLAILSVRWRE
ncbi:hypothetical protein [Salinicola peritrichatus]|uniref:hypothetical protein n=1 Tax=Salinicola peritrichatus TaxID=1267424 RepID=UPI000DA21ACD|nr:hypothetical protein [Salinicola peritrichatus]